MAGPGGKLPTEILVFLQHMFKNTFSFRENVLVVVKVQGPLIS